MVLGLFILAAVFSSSLNSKDSSTINVAEADFLLNEHEFVVASFVEDWCDACYRLLPIMKSIEADMNQNLKFISVDLDNDKHAWSYFKIHALPHIALIVRGTPIAYPGDIQLDDIKSWLDLTLKKGPRSIASSVF